MELHRAAVRSHLEALVKLRVTLHEFDGGALQDIAMTTTGPM